MICSLYKYLNVFILSLFNEELLGKYCTFTYYITVLVLIMPYQQTYLYEKIQRWTDG